SSASTRLRSAVSPAQTFSRYAARSAALLLCNEATKICSSVIAETSSAGAGESASPFYAKFSDELHHLFSTFFRLLGSGRRRVLSAGDFLMEPGPCIGPVAVGRGGRD